MVLFAECAILTPVVYLMFHMHSLSFGLKEYNYEIERALGKVRSKNKVVKEEMTSDQTR